MTSERALSRRSLLSASAVVGLGAVGLGSFALDDDDNDRPAYEVQQGLLRFPLDPVDHADENVREFYGYNEANRNSAELSRDITDRKHVSRLFMYDGEMHPSLVFLHGHPEADWGGRADITIDGVDFDSGEWAVRDDPPRIDEDFETDDQQRVHWRWGADRTDGGAFWGRFEEDFEITVTPREFSSGVGGWVALSQPEPHEPGEEPSIRRYQLDMDRPVTIRPRSQPIRDVDATVMPGEQPVFDPYAEEGRIEVEVSAVEGESADPEDLSEELYFGSRDALVEGNGAQPQSVERQGGRFLAEFSVQEAGFTTGHERGFLVGKTRNEDRILGSARVRPGGFGDEVETEPRRLPASNPRASGTHLSFRVHPEESVEVTGFSVDARNDLEGLDSTDHGHTFSVYEAGLVYDADEPLRLDGREYEFDGSGTVSNSWVQLEQFRWNRGVELTGFTNSREEADLVVTFALSDGSEAAVYATGHPRDSGNE
ncbi:hypothetical protein JCM17823_11500 [Halorubrum gandharaense]